MVERLEKVRRARSQLLIEQGEAPLSEICDRTGYEPDDVIKCLRLSRGMLSLEAPLADAEEFSLADVLPDPAWADMEETLDRAALQMLVRRAFDRLTPREAEVLAKRFGFGGAEPMTLDAIGREFGLTRERIRQIERRAKDKLAVALEEDRPPGRRALYPGGPGPEVPAGGAYPVTPCKQTARSAEAEAIRDYHVHLDRLARSTTTPESLTNPGVGSGARQEADRGGPDQASRPAHPCGAVGADRLTSTNSCPKA